MCSDVPADPLNKKYLISKTLPKNKEYRRVKQGLPPRYRMFFRFSTSQKNIIYVWFNDEFSIRKENDKNDVYQVFKKLLKNKTIPTNYDKLVKQSIVPKN